MFMKVSYYKYISSKFRILGTNKDLKFMIFIRNGLKENLDFHEIFYQSNCLIWYLWAILSYKKAVAFILLIVNKKDLI